MRKLKTPHNVASPGAFISATDFFELARAEANTLFGLAFGSAFACVGCLVVDVPTMPSVRKVCNNSRT